MIKSSCGLFTENSPRTIEDDEKWSICWHNEFQKAVVLVDGVAEVGEKSITWGGGWRMSILDSKPQRALLGNYGEEEWNILIFRCENFTDLSNH